MPETITIRLVDNIVTVAKMTDMRNEMVTSAKVAVIDLESDKGTNADVTRKTSGLVAFTLPEVSYKKKDLEKCKKRPDDDADDVETIIMVSKSYV